MLRVVAAVVAVVALTAAGAGCGDDDRDSRAEDAVRQLVAARAQVDIDEVAVSCPSAVDDGRTATCAVTVGGDELAVPVRARGDVLAPVDAVIGTQTAAEYLEGELATAAEGEVDVDCGDVALVVRPVGESFVCAAERLSDGQRFDVEVEVVSPDGEVRYEVVPPQ